MEERKSIINASLLVIGLLVIAAGLVAFGKSRDKEPAASGGNALTKSEKELIMSSDSVMYVLNIADKADSVILRTKSIDFNESDLKSEEFKTLAAKMLKTVQAPEYKGVGLAAPQIGLNHRVIVVQRLDKEGEPYEVYPNVHIDSLYGEKIVLAEGCLSKPTYRGNVERSANAVISYVNPQTMETVTETVSDYVARIFQHECDHLEGIMYTDKADSVAVDSLSLAEYLRFKEMGKYNKKR